MNDKELDSYMKTVNSNFDSHIEKGTIEMSNEYYNLLEEKMARLINKTQELKKQLEQYQEEVCILDMRTDENIKYKNQQKEFIKYLEDEKDRLTRACSNIYEDSLGHTRLVNEDKFDEVNDILQKYKEIMGDDKE